MTQERKGFIDPLNKALREKIDQMAAPEDRVFWRGGMAIADATGLALITAGMASGQWKATAIFIGTTLATKAALAVINRPRRH